MEALRPLGHVRAFWEGGAAAFGRVDEWSDLDLYVLTSEEKVGQTFRVVERELRRLSPISQVLTVSAGWEGVAQKFYRLEKAGEYQFVDLALVTEKAREKFITPEIHGNNVFHFDKDGVKGSEPLDRKKFGRALEARRRMLGERFRMFQNQVQKELNRGQGTEALEEYRMIVLGTLVELLRMKYNPVHYNFKMRYLGRELPKAVAERVEELAFVKDVRDLARKYRSATEWVDSLMAESKGWKWSELKGSDEH